jgi:hypothetical protein
MQSCRTYYKAVREGGAINVTICKTLTHHTPCDVEMHQRQQLSPITFSSSNAFSSETQSRLRVELSHPNFFGPASAVTSPIP